MIADRDDLISIDAKNGKRLTNFEHKIEKAQFVIVNERGETVVGGRDTIAAFAMQKPGRKGGRDTQGGGYALTNVQASAREIWRVKHKAPDRGVFRIVAGIALRATALYFRYGGLATSAIGLARTGFSLAGSVNSFRWSGLKTRFGSFDLSTLASNSTRNYVTSRIYSYGSFSRTPSLLNRVSGLQVITPSAIRGRLVDGIVDRATPSRSEVQESILDRLDPVRQVERLSDYLLRRKRLAELRGNHMYFYTDLPKPFDRKGLVGVNVHNGRDARYILNPDPDHRFVTDETLNLLYSIDGSRLQAFDILRR